ncbi:MAG: DUF805 domain-containing protein [Sphingobium sp.]|nr:DUF805 domain-containing protein [Sphingobium sp.]
MFGAIKYNLSNLMNFSGRDARSTFWYYVLFIVILRFAGGIAISLPMTVKATAGAMEAAQAHADAATINARMMTLVAETMPMVVWLGVALALITALLLAASIVRRLHDIGMSGWLVLVPAGLQAIVLAQAPAAIERVKEALARYEGTTAPDPTAMMQGQGMMVLLGWLPVLFIIVVGVIKSNEGPNRFGEAPVRF